MEITIDNTAKFNNKDLPINTYFITKDDKQHEGKIFLKTYGNKYVNILDGNETFDNHFNLEKCIIINKLKISIEQL